MPFTNKLILGTVQFGLPYGINNTMGMPSDEDVEQILDVAYGAGIHMLDTAEAYGNAIQRIGTYHRKKNHLFSVINKFKDPPAPVRLVQHVRENAEALNIPIVDTYLFHSYHDYLENHALLQGLTALKNSGAINSIGVSVYTNEQFDAVIDDDLVSVIQFPYNVLDNDNLRTDLMQKAKAKGKTLHTRSVFLQGLFFKNVNAFPAKLEPLTPYVDKIQKIAVKHQMDITAIALNYALFNPLIDGVLIGVESAEQLRNNLNAVKNNFASEIRDEVNSIVVKEVELLNPANWN